MVVLLLGDLLDLIQQLPDADLQLGHLLLLRHVGVVDGVFAHLDLEVDAQLRATEPGGAVRVETDDVLARSVRSEGDFA